MDTIVRAWNWYAQFWQDGPPLWQQLWVIIGTLWFGIAGTCWLCALSDFRAGRTFDHAETLRFCTWLFVATPVWFLVPLYFLTRYSRIVGVGIAQILWAIVSWPFRVTRRAWKDIRQAQQIARSAR